VLRPQTIPSFFASIAGAVVSCASCCAASFNLFPFDPETSEFIQKYHQSPDPEAAIDRYFALELEEFLSLAQQTDQPHSRAVLMAFYVQLIHDNPQLCTHFANRLVSEAKGEKAAFGAEVLAYGAGQARQESLSLVARGFDLPASALEAYVALEQFPYPQMEATNWQVLDVIWLPILRAGTTSTFKKSLRRLRFTSHLGPPWTIEYACSVRRNRNQEHVNILSLWACLPRKPLTSD
jgi:hypothetical protein